MAEDEDRQAPAGREGARPHGPAEVRPSATPSPERTRTDRLAAALAKAKARDATDPERYEPRVMNDELARELAGILELSDPAVAAEVRQGVAEARELFLAEEAAAARLPPPSDTVRRLLWLQHDLERSAERGTRPKLRHLEDPGVGAALARAGVDLTTELFATGKIGHGQRRGSRALAARLIDKEQLGKARTLVGRALELARGRAGVGTGRPRRQAMTAAVRRLAYVYWEATGRRPTRSGRREPSRYEKFLEAALGDLAGVSGTALAVRRERYGGAEQNLARLLASPSGT